MSGFQNRIYEIMVAYARMNDTRVFGKRGDVSENDVETGFPVFTDGLVGTLIRLTRS